MIYNHPLSPSSISRFLACPYSFFLRYSKNIKIPPSKAAQFGSMVHKINEEFWGEYEKVPNIEKALQESINKNWIDLGEEYENPTKTCLNNFEASLKENFIKPLYTEYKAENEENNTVAIIDLVFPQKIVDFKTSSVFTKKPKLPNIIQGVMCSINLKHCTGYDIRNVEFRYIKLGKTQFLEVTDELIEEVEDTIRDVRSKIKNDEFPKQDNCFKCDYKIICEMEERERERLCKNLKRNTYQSLS